MSIQGTSLKDTNIRLRFFSVAFMGILAFGAVLYWRSKLLENAEYVQIDTHQKPGSRLDPDALRSANYQIQVEDASPSAK